VLRVRRLRTDSSAGSVISTGIRTRRPVGEGSSASQANPSPTRSGSSWRRARACSCPAWPARSRSCQNRNRFTPSRRLICRSRSTWTSLKLSGCQRSPPHYLLEAFIEPPLGFGCCLFRGVGPADRGEDHRLEAAVRRLLNAPHREHETVAPGTAGVLPPIPAAQIETGRFRQPPAPSGPGDADPVAAGDAGESDGFPGCPTTGEGRGGAHRPQTRLDEPPPRLMAVYSPHPVHHFEYTAPLPGGNTIPAPIPPVKQRLPIFRQGRPRSPGTFMPLPGRPGKAERQAAGARSSESLMLVRRGAPAPPRGTPQNPARIRFQARPA